MSVRGTRNVNPIKEERLFFFTHTVAWSCANEKCRMYRKAFPIPVGVKPKIQIDHFEVVR
jgi:hypothetical protein